MKIKTHYLILATTLFLNFSCITEKKIYVSSQGDGTGNGSKWQPFLALDKARDEIRAKRLSGDTCTYSILLRGGEYPFINTLTFDNQDSKLVIAPYADEKVIFSGGYSVAPQKIIPVTGGKKKRMFPKNCLKNIYMVNLQELGINDYGKLHQIGWSHPLIPAWLELFVNGEPGLLARWPNDSTVAIGEIIDHGPMWMGRGIIPTPEDQRNRGGKFTYPGNRPSSWKASDDIWLSGYFKSGWADNAVKLADIDTVNRIFTTVHPNAAGYHSSEPWNRWYAYNVPEEIDVPGEYYIDRNEGILYFCYQGKIEKLEVSILESPGIKISQASDIIIQGITFTTFRGMAVKMESTNNCLIKDCTFKNLGLYAVEIDDSEVPKHPDNTLHKHEVGKNNGLANCLIFNTGSGGIRLMGGDRSALEAAGNYAENCSFHDFNRITKTYCAGIRISGVGNRISHCEIFNAPHSAILLSGNDHIIEYNDIHDVCTGTNDAGAVYYGRNPSERGNKVRYNYFHHIPGQFWTSAVYHDDGACGMEVFGNIFYNAGRWASLIGGGSDNSYINNIFIEGNVAIHVDNRFERTPERYPMLVPGGFIEQRLNEVKYNEPPYSIRYPELANYWDDNPAIPKRNKVDKNVFVNVGKIYEYNIEHLEFSKNNFITNEDPGFINAEEKDFGLKETSDVYIKVEGFQRLPFEEIGILNSNK